MKGGKDKGVTRWRPMLGVLGVGVLAFGLTLQGGPPNSQERAGRSDERVLANKGAVKRPGVSVAREIPVDLPMFPPVYAYPTEMVELGRRGLPMATWPADGRSGQAAQVADDLPGEPGELCLRDLDCDDCDPCTYDYCARGTCSGGDQAGRPCAINEQCPPINYICHGGTNDGDPCDDNSNCPPGKPDAYCGPEHTCDLYAGGAERRCVFIDVEDGQPGSATTASPAIRESTLQIRAIRT